MTFLSSISNNYKLRFDEQVLLFAQRPNATAVLEIDKWYKHYNRWIKNGSKGIAVFNLDGGIKHYFDISDTYAVEKLPSVFVPIWTVKPEYEQEIIETLENAFGSTENNENLSNAIIQSVRNIVNDNSIDHIDTLLSVKQNSFIETISERETSNLYKEILTNSVSYLVQARCGINIDNEYYKSHLKKVRLFNTKNTINALGIGISELSKTILREIASTVLVHEKELFKNRTFDKSNNIRDNVSVIKTEGSKDNGIEIQREGQLSDSRSGNQRRTTESGRQIRLDEAELPDTTQESTLSILSDGGRAEQSLDGDRTNSTETIVIDDRTNEKTDEHNGGIEENKPDEMGRSDEQPQEFSGRRDNKRTDLQLKIEDNTGVFEEISNTPFTMKEEPKQFAEKEQKNNVIEQDRQNENIAVDISENDTKITSEKEVKINVNIGDKLKINNTEFMIYSYNNVLDYYNLVDTSRLNSGIPILIAFKPEELKKHLSEKEPEIVEQIIESEPLIESTPDIKQEPILNNFIISDNNIGHGGAKEKYRRNIKAINVLHDIESEDRLATPEEQKILSEYVGWGGLSDVFDERKTNWKEEFSELYATLSPTEYKEARATTLSAFYTPPIVIKSMYSALESMGFEKGNILEPSCGTGNFFGLMPETMKNSKVYGVEIDSLSGRIAKQLYPNYDLQITGFENTEFQDGSFDVVIGNVPFGQFKVHDRSYDKHNFLIHDYFFAKAIDKARNGGIIAFITSKGTMDKENSQVRKYIAQRAELIGAIRLPDITFRANAGTEVTADIIFLKKRDRMIETEPDWIYLDSDKNGIKINRYFIDNPHMIMGDMVMESTQFGFDSTCKSNGENLEDLLKNAITNLNYTFEEQESNIDELEQKDESIEADPTVRNFSYTLINDKIYFRNNSRMIPVNEGVTNQNRIKGMIELCDCVRNLIHIQEQNYSENEIIEEQKRLNVIYDKYTKEYGLINSRGNSSAFSDDSSYYLLCSLEILDDDGKLKQKADMFYKRTIKANIVIEKVDTAQEALAVSIGEKGCIDLDYMAQLSGIDRESIIEDLKGDIYYDIDHLDNSKEHSPYVTADQYLSGNVRKKLKYALKAKEENGSDIYDLNIEALRNIQPLDLTPSDISVNLGSTWVPDKYIEQFVHELMGVAWYLKPSIKVFYNQKSSLWTIEGKSIDKGLSSISKYGTTRINAYKIIENTLNMKDVRIFDYITDDNGKKKAVLNKKQTDIATDRQELIKRKFKEWIWKDDERKNDLVQIYNEKFNSIVPRKYNGNNIRFSGMNPEITLRKHQIDAVARILYGGNTLLAHCVGAGKTFEMIAAAQESKRLGLCNKSIITVPKNIIGQFASDYLRLYPSANILVSREKDFETKNRKKFCGRIATGNFDAIILGHSQFEKIPLSVERQAQAIEQQIDDIIEGISDLEDIDAPRYSIKQLERTRQSLELQLKELNSQDKKDDVVTFEELGVDRLFVDEAHYFKNLFLYTKMTDVAGIQQTQAMRSNDMFMKTRYLDELTNYKGVIFATGTPISNSMVELYTMQRYLQYNALEDMELVHFDSWASTFGETITTYELAPEGTKYQKKTRFSKFQNLPELFYMFREVADIQTAEMLDLPKPKANFHNVLLKASDYQKEIIHSFAERADKIRNGNVDPSVDNMLKITNEGRKLALDQRLINPLLPDNPDNKVNACMKNVFEIWEKTTEKKSTQLIFCDLSTPKEEGIFDVYNDIKEKLIKKRVPEEEIAFIHDYNTDKKKQFLFSKVRSGEIRILLGSTQKLGTGTNIQDKIIAQHDSDCPWRPSDLEQRLGRSIRQGNENDEVDIYRYLTEDTFDTYMFQLLENKQRAISQIMTGKTPIRVMEDIDELTISYAEMKALTTGNSFYKDKMNLEIEISKLLNLQADYQEQQRDIQQKISIQLPSIIKDCERRIKDIQDDIIHLNKNTINDKEAFNSMEIKGFTYTEKEKAGEALISACKELKSNESLMIGSYRGFNMYLSFEFLNYKLKLMHHSSYTINLGDSPHGNITRIENVLNSFSSFINEVTRKLKNAKSQLEVAKKELGKPFLYADELIKKNEELEKINALIEEEPDMKNEKKAEKCSVR